MARLSFRCDERLVERVDLARGLVARERWLREAVERALGEQAAHPENGFQAPNMVVRQSPAPAEQSSWRAVEVRWEPGDPLPSACPHHPEAGRVKSGGSWWCAEPGCSVGLA